MRRGKRNADEPFSLFSFQDVITSLAGVMLVVLLLLVLQRAMASGEEGPPAPIEHPPIEPLRRTLAERMAERDSLPEVPPPPAEPEMTREEVREREHDLEAARERGRELAGLLARRQQELAQWQRRQTAQARENVEQLVEEADALRRREAELQEEVETFREGRTLHFIPEAGSGRSPILVQCSRQELRVMSANEESIDLMSDDDLTVQPGIQRLAQWLAGRNKSAEAVVLLLKPSAAGFWGDLERVLKEAGWEYGYEPLLEDQDAQLTPRGR